MARRPRPIRDMLNAAMLQMRRKNPLPGGMQFPAQQPVQPVLQPGALQPLQPDLSTVMAAAGGAQAGGAAAPAPGHAFPSHAGAGYYGHPTGPQVATAAGFGACVYEAGSQTVLCAGARYPAEFVRSGVSAYGRSMALVRSSAFDGGTKWVEFSE